MFIRVNTTPNSPRKSIQICENQRVGDKVKQKIVRYVGIAHDEHEEQKLKDYAAGLITKITLEREQQAQQQSLFSSSEEELNGCKKIAGRPRRKAIEDILPPSQVTLDDIIEEARLVETPATACARCGVITFSVSGEQTSHATNIRKAFW
jgi:hypothetical protein